MELLARGKVRELYAVDDQHVLVVASDRISAYDHVLPTEIPGKGAVLTALSAWWFEQLEDLVPHHLVSTEDVPAHLRGRAMLCRRLTMLPVECVARGRVTGSGLADYRRDGALGGVALPAGLEDGDPLPTPVFTPATKAAVGDHDENVSYERVVADLGEPTAAELRRLTLAVYERAAAVAAARGIVVADTKLEFGRDADGRLTLGDEVLTPDSSRFWPADGVVRGGPQPSYDKQYVRDWLRAHWSEGEPVPPLPDEVVAQTRARYVEAYERLTGRSFADWPVPAS